MPEAYAQVRRRRWRVLGAPAGLWSEAWDGAEGGSLALQGLGCARACQRHSRHGGSSEPGSPAETGCDPSGSTRHADSACRTADSACRTACSRRFMLPLPPHRRRAHGCRALRDCGRCSGSPRARVRDARKPPPPAQPGTRGSPRRGGSVAGRARGALRGSPARRNRLRCCSLGARACPAARHPPRSRGGCGGSKGSRAARQSEPQPSRLSGRAAQPAGALRAGWEGTGGK